MYSDNIEWLPIPSTRILALDKFLEMPYWQPLAKIFQENQWVLTVEQIEEVIQGNGHLLCVAKLHWEETLLKASEKGEVTNDLTHWSKASHFQAVDLTFGACVFVYVYLEKMTGKLKVAIDRNRTSAALWGGSNFQDTVWGNWFITNLVLKAPLQLISELLGHPMDIESMPVLSKIVDLKISGIL